MTARAPLLGSTISLALGLTVLHVNTAPMSRLEKSGLQHPRIVGAADADRSCRISRYPIGSITVPRSARCCTIPVPRVYSARDKFFLKWKVNRQIFSVNCRSARTIGTIGSTGHPIRSARRRQRTRQPDKNRCRATAARRYERRSAGNRFRQRRTAPRQLGPAGQGGYNVLCTLIDRSLPNVHPYGNLAIRADGKEAINGRHSELLSCRQRCRVRYLSGRPSRVK